MQTFTVYIASTATVTVEADSPEDAERIAVFRAPRTRELCDWHLIDTQVTPT